MAQQQLEMTQHLLNEAAARRYMDHRNVLDSVVNLLETIDLGMVIKITEARASEMERTSAPPDDQAQEALALLIARSLLHARENCRRAMRAKAERDGQAASGLVVFR